MKLQTESITCICWFAWAIVSQMHIHFIFVMFGFDLSGSRCPEPVDKDSCNRPQRAGKGIPSASDGVRLGHPDPPKRGHWTAITEGFPNVSSWSIGNPNTHWSLRWLQISGQKLGKAACYHPTGEPTWRLLIIVRLHKGIKNVSDFI